MKEKEEKTLYTPSASTSGYKNPYAGEIDQIYEKITNRDPFAYNVNDDALYQQMKDQYIRGGQMAMMDTMGQAQAMTGGYGNSYAQSAGQNAYQNYLTGLNEQVPELYQLALNNYLNEGDQMAMQYSMLLDKENTAYSRHQDEMALIQPQVMEMLNMGIMPSDEMLAASGLSREYAQALYNYMTGGTGDGGSDYAPNPNPNPKPGDGLEADLLAALAKGTEEPSAGGGKDKPNYYEPQRKEYDW